MTFPVTETAGLLRQAGQVTLDSSGTGTLTFAPASARERWEVTSAVVSTNQAATAEPPVVSLAKNTTAAGLLSQGNVRARTWSGNQAVMAGLWHVSAADFLTVAFAPAPGASAAQVNALGGGYDTAVLADAPVLFWNDATGTDATGHGHTLTLHGGPTSAGLPNGDRALWFSGTSAQYGDAGDNAAFSPVTTNRFTVEAWINPGTLQFAISEGTGYVYWAGKDTPNPSEWACRMYNLVNSEGRPGRISGYAFNSGGGLGVGSFFEDPVEAGYWIHYVLVINKADAGGSFPDGYTKIYKNGGLRDQDDLAGITLSDTAAALRVGTATRSSFFLGGIGKFAVYGTELSAARVLAHYRAMTGGVICYATVTGTRYTRRS